MDTTPFLSAVAVTGASCSATASVGSGDGCGIGDIARNARVSCTLRRRNGLTPRIDSSGTDALAVVSVPERKLVRVNMSARRAGRQ